MSDVMEDLFQNMVNECFGDMGKADPVVKQAMQLTKDFMSDSQEDALQPLNCLMMAFFMCAACIPSLDHKHMQEFMADRLRLMYPCAQFIAFREMQKWAGEITDDDARNQKPESLQEAIFRAVNDTI